MSFDAPIRGIGADYPGAIRFTLINDDQIIYESPAFGSGPMFTGLLSSVAFDEVVLYDWGGSLPHAIIDDLHFGPAIPAPPVLAIFGVILIPRRRRCVT